MRRSNLLKQLGAFAIALVLAACGGGEGSGGGSSNSSGGTSGGSGTPPTSHGTIVSAHTVTLNAPIYVVADTSYTMQSTAPGPFLAVRATQLPNGSAVWIGATSEALWLSSNQGASWQYLRSFTFADLGAGADGAAFTSYQIVGFDMDSSNANTFTLALASYGASSGIDATLVYHSSDGQTLVPVFSNDLTYTGTALSGAWLDSRVPLVGLSQDNGTGITLAGEDGTLLASGDAGATWSVLTAASVNALPAGITPQQGVQVHWALSGNHAVALYGNHLWMSNDGGRTGSWIGLNASITADIPAVNPAGQIVLVHAQQVSSDGKAWGALSNPNNLPIGDAMFWVGSNWYSQTINADYTSSWQPILKSSLPVAFHYALSSTGWNRVGTDGSVATCAAPAHTSLAWAGGAVVAWSTGQGVVGISQDACATWTGGQGNAGWRVSNTSMFVQDDGVLYALDAAGDAPQISLDGGASWRTLGVVPTTAPAQIIPAQGGSYALFDAQGDLMVSGGVVTPASAVPGVTFGLSAPVWLANGEEALLGQSCPTDSASGICRAVLVLLKIDSSGTRLQLDRSLFVDGQSDRVINIAQDGKTLLLAPSANTAPDRWLSW